MNSIAGCLKELRIGEPQSHCNLALFPLLDGKASTLEYLLLDEALANGALIVTELDEQGSVPELRAVNSCARRVLLLDGEELIGANQDRILNATILIEAHSEVVIPVSCVEVGRWRRVNTGFAASDNISHVRLRRRKSAHVAASVAHGRGFAANQVAVWEEVGRKLHVLSCASRSGALAAAFAGRQGDLETFVDGFKPLRDQCGAVVAIDGRIECADIFDRPDTLARLLPKLVRSYALDAIEATCGPNRPPDREEVQAFLDQAMSAHMEARPSVGLGEDCRVRGAHVHGAGLVVEGTVVHLSLFSLHDPRRVTGHSGRPPRPAIGRGRGDSPIRFAGSSDLPGGAMLMEDGI